MTKKQIEQFKRQVEELDAELRSGKIDYAYAYGFLTGTCKQMIATADERENWRLQSL